MVNDDLVSTYPSVEEMSDKIKLAGFKIESIEDAVNAVGKILINCYTFNEKTRKWEEKSDL